MPSQSAIVRSFTLIELMAVIVLMSLAVGMTVVGLDGFSQKGRLRAALGQVAALDALARTQAVCDGRPRRLEFEPGTAMCVLLRPERHEGEWRWTGSLDLALGHGVVIAALVNDTKRIGTESARRDSVVVRGDGVSPTYAVEVRAGAVARAALCVDGVTGLSRMEFEPPAELSALWPRMEEPE